MNWTLEQAQQFESGLRRQQGLYQGLMECTQRQMKELPEPDDAAGLAKLLSEKQDWMSGIEALEGQLSGGKRDWPDARESLPAVLAESIEQQLVLLQKVLKELIGVEEAASRELQQRLDSGRTALRAISRRHNAARAYGGPGMRAGSRFVDNKK